jgi:tetratricopeptide (TPR) repeat protein
MRNSIIVFFILAVCVITCMSSPVIAAGQDRLSTLDQLLFEGKFAEVKTECDKMLERSPNDPFLLMSRGMANRGLRNYKDSIADLTKSIELFPENMFAWNERGISYTMMKMYDKAIDDFKCAIITDPRLLSSSTMCAKVYIATGKYDDAISVVDEALKVETEDPTYSALYMCKAMAYYKKGDMNEARSGYKTGIEKSIASPLLFTSPVVPFCSETPPELLVDELSFIIAMEPDSAGYVAGRAHEYMKLKEYSKAISDYNKADKLQPDEYIVLASRGWTYYMAGQYDKALQDCERAVNLKSDPYDALDTIGWVYFKKGKYDQALDYFNKALAVKSDHPESLCGKGAILCEQEKYDEALTYLNKAIEIDQLFVDAWLFRGVARTGKKYYDKAISDLGRAITLDPGCALAYYYLGVAYMFKGDVDNSRKNVNKAVELDRSLNNQERWLELKTRFSK